MAEAGQSIAALATYLGVKAGKVTLDGRDKLPVVKGKTGTRRGLVSITKHLVRAAEKNSLLGNTAEDQAAVDQWLEYRVSQLDRCQGDKELAGVLKELNAYLADKVYFVNHTLSLADILLYYGLHTHFVGMPFYDKENYMHVSRWFDNVQHEKGLRQTFPYVHFLRTQIYDRMSH
ncbi:hypothetical protein CHS0354_022388 [Potamilus streckersoni]|uniref:GST C-terminal domain-containing protein n=1 Tax=Potamilus streckersoni TaxID=2493646 RepID=A0AAE0W456_9BIVA|nr:hypothetical protein CHS0354_022388 [Potamilus streckersoni]